MQYKTYDELIKMVAEFRSEHRNLTDDELDKLVKQTFRIDQATLREINGSSDQIDAFSTKGRVKYERIRI